MTKFFAYPFTDKSRADAGCSLEKFSWKSTKDKDSGVSTAGHATRCVSIPFVSFDFTSAGNQWSAFFADAFCEFQRSLVHEFLTASLDGGVSSPAIEIPEFLFEKEEVLKIWNEQQASKGKGRGKLSADAIGEFFDGVMIDPIKIGVCEKKGWNYGQLSELETKQLGQAMNSYRALMKKLAGADKLDMNSLEIAQKALGYVPEDKRDATFSRIVARVEKMKKVETIDLEDLL